MSNLRRKRVPFPKKLFLCLEKNFSKFRKLCFLWVLKNIDKIFLNQWWFTLSIGRYCIYSNTRSLTHSHIHSLTHVLALVHSLIHSITHSLILIHSLTHTHPHIHSLIHSPTHSPLVYSDCRYSNREIRSRIASIYLPLLTIVLDNFHCLYKVSNCTPTTATVTIFLIQGADGWDNLTNTFDRNTLVRRSVIIKEGDASLEIEVRRLCQSAVTYALSFFVPGC